MQNKKQLNLTISFQRENISSLKTQWVNSLLLDLVDYVRPWDRILQHVWLYLTLTKE